jgi:hypothetical protein
MKTSGDDVMPELSGPPHDVIQARKQRRWSQSRSSEAIKIGKYSRGQNIASHYVRYAGMDLPHLSTSVYVLVPYFGLP